MQRVVVLPNGRDCGLGKYIAAWKTLKKMGADMRVEGFGYSPESARDVLREMRSGMTDRINQKAPGYGRSRKWDPMYQTDQMRDARALKDIQRRVRVYHFNTAVVRQRFGHLLATREEM